MCLWRLRRPRAEALPPLPRQLLQWGPALLAPSKWPRGRPCREGAAASAGMCSPPCSCRRHARPAARAAAAPRRWRAQASARTATLRAARAARRRPASPDAQLSKARPPTPPSPSSPRPQVTTDSLEDGSQHLQAEIDVQVASTMNYLDEVQRKLRNIGWARKLLRER